MNEYLFTTIEGTTVSPNSIDVENCQLLARVDACNMADARSKLIEENKWIKEAGFSLEKLIIDQVLTKEQISDIKAIVDYLLEEGERSYIAEDCLPGHVYLALKRLRDVVID